MIKALNREKKPKKEKTPMLPALKALRWKIAIMIIGIITIAYILVLLNHFGVIHTY